MAGKSFDAWWMLLGPTCRTAVGVRLRSGVFLSRDSMFALNQGGVKLCVCVCVCDRERGRVKVRVFVVEKGELPVHRLFKKCFMMDLCPWGIFLPKLFCLLTKTSG